MAHRGRTNADDALTISLAMGKSLRQAAKDAGIAERTARRRWQDPEFRRQVMVVRGDWMGRVVGRLVRSSTKAAATLEALLDSEVDRVRLAAARSILDISQRLREASEIEERLKAIEEKVPT